MWFGIVLFLNINIQACLWKLGIELLIILQIKLAILVMVEADSYKERNKYSDIFRLVCTYLNVNHHILSRISNFEIGIFKKFSINQIVFNNNQASRNHSNLLKFSGKSVVENSVHDILSRIRISEFWIFMTFSTNQMIVSNIKRKSIWLKTFMKIRDWKFVNNQWGEQ